MSKREKQIEKMLRQMGVESPSEGFSGRVMDKIEAQEQEEIAFEKVTKGIVQKAGLEEPSPHFTHNIMQHIGQEQESLPAYEPVIGKKAWIGIAAAFAALMGWIVFTGDVSGITPIAEEWMAMFEGATGNVLGFLANKLSGHSLIYFLLTAFVLSVFMLLNRTSKRPVAL